MANYGRNTGENLSKANKGAKVGLGAFLAAVAVSTIASGSKTSKKQELAKQIAELDREINDLSTGFLATWRNSDAIEEKKQRRAQLEEEYQKYQ